MCQGEANSVEAALHQPVPLRNRLPDRSAVLHLRLERRGLLLETDPLDAELLGDARPHPVPAKHVAVGDVVSVVLGEVVNACPDELLAEHAGVGHIGQSVPLRFAAGELERTAGLLADHGEGGERRAHIHGVADRLADDRVRPVHAPSEAEALRRLVDLVFLVIVEIREGEPRVLFAHRRHRQSSGARISFERPKVVLEAGHQRDVPDAALAADDLERAPHDPGVRLDIFLFAPTPHPDREVDVGRLHPRERPSERVCIEHVRVNRPHALDEPFRTPRKPVDLGPRVEQRARSSTSCDAGSSDNKRLDVHGRLPCGRNDPPPFRS